MATYGYHDIKKLVEEDLKNRGLLPSSQDNSFSILFREESIPSYGNFRVTINVSPPEHKEGPYR